MYTSGKRSGQMRAREKESERVIWWQQKQHTHTRTQQFSMKKIKWQWLLYYLSSEKKNSSGIVYAFVFSNGSLIFFFAHSLALLALSLALSLFIITTYKYIVLSPLKKKKYHNISIEKWVCLYVLNCYVISCW